MRELPAFAATDMAPLAVACALDGRLSLLLSLARCWNHPQALHAAVNQGEGIGALAWALANPTVAMVRRRLHK